MLDKQGKDANIDNLIDLEWSHFLYTKFRIWLGIIFRNENKIKQEKTIKDKISYVFLFIQF